MLRVSFFRCGHVVIPSVYLPKLLRYFTLILRNCKITSAHPNTNGWWFSIVNWTLNHFWPFYILKITRTCPSIRFSFSSWKNLFRTGVIRGNSNGCPNIADSKSDDLCFPGRKISRARNNSHKDDIIVHAYKKHEARLEYCRWLKNRKNPIMATWKSTKNLIKVVHRKDIQNW